MSSGIRQINLNECLSSLYHIFQLALPVLYGNRWRIFLLIEKVLTAHCTEGYVINDCYEGWTERKDKLVHINAMSVLAFQSSTGTEFSIQRPETCN